MASGSRSQLQVPLRTPR